MQTKTRFKHEKHFNDSYCTLELSSTAPLAAPCCGPDRSVSDCDRQRRPKKKSPVECLVSRRRLTGFIFNGAPLPRAASSLPSEGRLLLQPLDRVFADSLRPVGRLHACRKDLGEVLVRTSL